MAIADTTQFANLLNDGVASIQMDLFGYREAYEYAKQNGRVEGAGFFSALTGLLTSDVDSSDAMNKIKTRVSFTLGHDWFNPSIKENLVSVATKAMNSVDEHDAVTIVTKTGIKINTIQSNGAPRH